MTPTGTHFNYYQLCHRKLWLFANGINMERNLMVKTRKNQKKSEVYHDLEQQGHIFAVRNNNNQK